MKINGVDLNKTEVFYFNGNLDCFDNLKIAMELENIDTQKVNILNITKIFSNTR